MKLDLLLTVLRRRILWAPTISYVQHEQPALDFVAAAEPLLLDAVARVLGYADLAAVPAGVQAAWQLGTGGGLSLSQLLLELRVQALLHWANTVVLMSHMDDSLRDVSGRLLRAGPADQYGRLRPRWQRHYAALRRDSPALRRLLPRKLLAFVLKFGQRRHALTVLRKALTHGLADLYRREATRRGDDAAVVLQRSADHPWVREAVLARSSGSACWEWDGDTYRTYLNLVHGHVPFAIGDESLYDSTRCGCGELLTYAHLQVCKRARHRHHTDKAPGAVDAGLGSEVNRHHAVCDQLAEGLRRLFPGASVTREQTLAQHVPRLDVLLDFGAGEKYGYDVSFKSLFKANGTPAHPRLLREGGWAAQKRDAEKVAAYAPMQGCEFVPVSFEAPTARPSACFVRHIERLWLIP